MKDEGSTERWIMFIFRFFFSIFLFSAQAHAPLDGPFQLGSTTEPFPKTTKKKNRARWLLRLVSYPHPPILIQLHRPQPALRHRRRLQTALLDLCREPKTRRSVGHHIRSHPLPPFHQGLTSPARLHRHPKPQASTPAR